MDDIKYINKLKDINTFGTNMLSKDLDRIISSKHLEEEYDQNELSYYTTRKLTLDSNGKPLIDVENKSIEEIWTNYKNLSIKRLLALTIYDFNQLLASFLKYLPQNPDLYTKINSIIYEMEELPNVELDVSTYNILMTSCVRIGDLTTLYEYFQAFFNDDVKPNTISYNILISGYINTEQKSNRSLFLRSAFYFFDNMVSQGVERNNKTYTLLIKACGEMYDYPKALGLFNKLIEDGIEPDTIVCNALLSVISKTHRDPSKAIELFNEMKSRKLQPTIITYNIIIGFMKKIGEEQLALEYFELMKKDGILPDAKILESIGIVGIKAIRMLRDEFNTMPKLIDYNLMLYSELQESDYEDALEVYRHMQKHNVKPNLTTYAIIIDDHVKGEKPDNALDIFNVMLKENLKIDFGIYKALINSYLNNRDLDKVFYLIDLLKKKSNIRLTLGSLESILKTAARLPDPSIIEKVFKYLKESKIIAENQNHRNLYNILLNKLASSSSIEILENYLDGMENDKIPIVYPTFSSIIKGCGLAKKFNEMECWYQRMILKYKLKPNSQILSVIINTFIDDNNLNLSIVYFREFFKYDVRINEDDVIRLLNLFRKFGSNIRRNIVLNILEQNGYEDYITNYNNRVQLIKNKLETFRWLEDHKKGRVMVERIIHQKNAVFRHNNALRKLEGNAANRLRLWQPFSKLLKDKINN
nr:10541_t:CDS:1 [Entrophospora candida]